MFVEIGKTNESNPDAPIAIYDARPRLSAQANKLKGGGFEDERYYTNCKFTFCGIDNIHAVTKAYDRLAGLP